MASDMNKHFFDLNVGYFVPTEGGVEDMSSLTRLRDEESVSIRISDLLVVYPELRRDDESNSKLAEKIVRAAEWNRGMDADTDLFSRLNPDTVEEEATELRLKENK